MIALAWRSIAMGACFVAGLAEPAVWIVALLVILALMGAHLWEAFR